MGPHQTWHLLHATARAVSVGPRYVSDTLGAHDLELLARVVVPDGGAPEQGPAAMHALKPGWLDQHKAWHLLHGTARALSEGALSMPDTMGAQDSNTPACAALLNGGPVRLHCHQSNASKPVLSAAVTPAVQRAAPCLQVA